MSEVKVNKNRVDVSQIFLVYMALVGDVTKTALALEMEPEEVQALAIKEGWAEKVQRISLVSKGGGDGDWERAQNRALNFVQAHQLRRAIDREMAKLAENEPGELLKVVDKHGTTRYSGRIFSDLAAAMQSIHQMTYAALGDTVKEREARLEQTGDPHASGGIHATMIAALNNARLDTEEAQRLLHKERDDKVQQVIDIPAT